MGAFFKSSKKEIKLPNILAAEGKNLTDPGYWPCWHVYGTGMIFCQNFSRKQMSGSVKIEHILNNF